MTQSTHLSTPRASCRAGPSSTLVPASPRSVPASPGRRSSPPPPPSSPAAAAAQNSDSAWLQATGLPSVTPETKGQIVAGGRSGGAEEGRGLYGHQIQTICNGEPQIRGSW